MCQCARDYTTTRKTRRVRERANAAFNWTLLVGLLVETSALCNNALLKQATSGSDIHYNDVIMSATASQITSLSVVFSNDCFGADQRKHQSSASLAFMRGSYRRPVNSPHKGPVIRKMFPYDGVTYSTELIILLGDRPIKGSNYHE